jgi:hypothetical protein
VNRPIVAGNNWRVAPAPLAKQIESAATDA